MTIEEPYDPYGEEPIIDKQTRDATHPGGFSFLQEPSGIFWPLWLQFTSDELARLAFMRWQYGRDQLGEFTEVPSESS